MAKPVISSDGEFLLNATERDELVEEHQSTFGRARAQGLAMVWYNSSYIGCRYPSEVERLVAGWMPSKRGRELGKKRASSGDMPEPARKRRSGEQSVTDTDDKKNWPYDQRADKSQQQTTNCNQDDEGAVTMETDQEGGDDIPAEVMHLASRIRMRAPNPNKTAVSELLEACQASRVAVEYSDDLDAKPLPGAQQPGWCAMKAVVDGVTVAFHSGVGKKPVKHGVAEKALAILRQAQQRLQISVLPSSVSQAERVVAKEELLKESFQKATPIADDNKGSMLLRKMGWSGSGGLGKTGEGRTEPVVATETRIGSGERTGMGTVSDGGKLNRRSVQQILNNFLASDEQCIAFSSDLTKENRAIVHTLSQRMGLSHRSYGKDGERQLLVQKKVDMINGQANASSSNVAMAAARTEVPPPRRGNYTSHQALNRQVKQLKSQMPDPFFGGGRSNQRW